MNPRFIHTLMWQNRGSSALPVLNFTLHPDKGVRIVSMKKLYLLLLPCLALLFAACAVPHTDPTPTPTEEPAPTETPLPEPTPTIPPSAAVVNGLYIAVEDVDAKKAQLRDACEQLGEEIPDDSSLREEALDDLIDETLFLAAARLRGAAPDSLDLDTQIQALCVSLGSCDALREWQSKNHYSEDSFRRALERELAAANMREIIFAELKNVEQLHVYRIWSARRADLEEVLTRLGMGVPFVDMARNYDEVTGGDMSWFPRGVMFSREVEDRIFALNAGEHTDIMEIDGVYNLFYVAEKQSGRGMDTQVEQLAQRKALADWLEEQKRQAVIEIL